MCIFFCITNVIHLDIVHRFHETLKLSSFNPKKNVKEYFQLEVDFKWISVIDIGIKQISLEVQANSENKIYILSIITDTVEFMRQIN